MKHLLLTLFSLMASTTLLAYDAEIDGICYNFSGDKAEVTYNRVTGKYNMPAPDYSGVIEIPSSVSYEGKTYSVTSIGMYSFYGCDALVSINIPESVTSIGVHSFEGCKGLNSITIPEGITRIEDFTFCGCSSLGNVSIPEGVTDIGFNAFYECGSLEFINIPSSVNSIWGYAFDRCSSLISFSFPEGVTWVCDYVLFNCDNLKMVTIPESTKVIGMGALAYCSNLAKINIPDSVELINQNAFKGCSSLASVTISENVNYIYGGAFSGCTGLTSVICKSQVPTHCVKGAFDEVDKGKCILYVPQGSEDAYRTAEEWKDFYIIEMGTGISEMKNEGVKSEKYTNETYDLQGCKLQQASQKGVHIQNGRKVMVR